MVGFPNSIIDFWITVPVAFATRAYLGKVTMAFIRTFFTFVSSWFTWGPGFSGGWAAAGWPGHIFAHEVTANWSAIVDYCDVSKTRTTPEKMVFCYQKCLGILWENIVLVIEKKLLKFEAEGREFAKILRSLEQFIQTMKGQNNFW